MALRFGVNDRIEVRLAQPHDCEVDLRRPETCPTGRWKAGRVVEVNYRQEHWCPSYSVPYLVGLDGENEATLV